MGSEPEKSLIVPIEWSFMLALYGDVDAIEKVIKRTSAQMGKTARLCLRLGPSGDQV